jgi:putative DNA primase/helicase
MDDAAPAPPGTPAPLSAEFLDRITAGDVELQSYLQRVAGYCLTGSVAEHALFFFYGTGANGKSVFVNTLLGILSDYALTIGTAMLMVSASTGTRPKLRGCAGCAWPWAAKSRSVRLGPRARLRRSQVVIASKADICGKTSSRSIRSSSW